MKADKEGEEGDEKETDLAACNEILARTCDNVTHQSILYVLKRIAHEQCIKNGEAYWQF